MLIRKDALRELGYEIHEHPNGDLYIEPGRIWHLATTKHLFLEAKDKLDLPPSEINAALDNLAMDLHERQVFNAIRATQSYIFEEEIANKKAK